MSHNTVLGGLVNELVGQLEGMVKPSAGTKVLRSAGVQCVLMFTVFVYSPSGHFGQASASGNVQDPSSLVASGSDLFKKVPGSQHNTRFPGGMGLAINLFQLGEHHTPWLKAAAFNSIS